MVESTDERSPVLDVRNTRSADAVVVAISGELDADTAPRVRAALATGADATTSVLVFDMSDVVFFGSPGLSLLLEARQRVHGNGGAFAVVATHRAVLRPLELTALSSLLDIFPSVDEALATVDVRAHLT